MTSGHAHAQFAVRPIILSGGAGTRLWPVSRATNPKQLLPIIGEQTMLQATAARVARSGYLSPLVVADERHRFAVRNQLHEAGAVPEAILLEPAGRNTAAAIGLAANWVLQQSGDELLLVLPSDHVIQDLQAFSIAIETAAPAAQAGGLVTFGVRPDQPHSGYGYIEVADQTSAEAAIHRVARFVEKPSSEVAREYVESRRFLWNSGMFLFRASAIVAELERFAPEVAKAVAGASRRSIRDVEFVRPDGPAFMSAPSISIDCAVMERSDNAFVVPVEMGWSDVGSWESLWAISPRDERGNVTRGPVLAVSSRDCLIRSEHEQLVVAVGVEGLAIVATTDAILISDHLSSQEVKAAVEMLRARGHGSVAGVSDAALRCSADHSTVEDNERCRCRPVAIDPGGARAVGSDKRPQCWIVTKGTAEVTLGTDVRTLRADQSVCVGEACAGQIANPSAEPLHLIVVEYGPVSEDEERGRVENSDNGNSSASR